MIVTPVGPAADGRKPEDETVEIRGDGDKTARVRIGRYTLVRRLGEGEFATVYLAEEHAPLNRKVALKVIKVGMDTEAFAARFDTERRALALMDHPNVARVIDAGTTPRGRPFIAMEYVRGPDIGRFCDSRHCTLRERLELFARICNAVQHAHQKGIIHRDLKPSNILVAADHDEPSPKIIDFGIAKATAGTLLPDAAHTWCDQLVGTPLYMSPEQAEMGATDIDTRTDIYSLGILLYQLVTGSTPFGGRRGRAGSRTTVEAIRQRVLSEEPRRPSSMLASMDRDKLARIAAERGTTPRKLVAEARGDLDRIVMKAIRKDRTLRYETASGLALDVHRFLDHEPVRAASPSTLYSARKLVQRHPAATVFLSMLLLMLTVSTVILTMLVVELRQTKAQLESAMVDLRAERDELLFFERALGSAQAGRWHWNLGTGELRWDDRMFEVFGRDRTKWTPNYGGFQDCLDPDDREDILKIVQDCIDNRTGFSAVFRAIDDQGETRYIRAYGLAHDDGTMSGINIRVQQPDYNVSLPLTLRSASEIGAQEHGTGAESSPGGPHPQGSPPLREPAAEE